jgi:hypothetical protein
MRTAIHALVLSTKDFYTRAHTLTTKGLPAVLTPAHDDMKRPLYTHTFAEADAATPTLPPKLTTTTHTFAHTTIFPFLAQAKMGSEVQRVHCSIHNATRQSLADQAGVVAGAVKQLSHFKV